MFWGNFRNISLTYSSPLPECAEVGCLWIIEVGRFLVGRIQETLLNWASHQSPHCLTIQPTWPSSLVPKERTSHYPRRHKLRNLDYSGKKANPDLLSKLQINEAIQQGEKPSWFQLWQSHNAQVLGPILFCILQLYSFLVFLETGPLREEIRRASSSKGFSCIGWTFECPSIITASSQERAKKAFGKFKKMSSYLLLIFTNFGIIL